MDVFVPMEAGSQGGDALGEVIRASMLLPDSMQFQVIIWIGTFSKELCYTSSSPPASEGYQTVDENL